MKKVLALTLVIMTLVVALPTSAANFTDINSSHWAYSAINELVAKGTIGGYTDGSFRPNNTVTRAEFVKMVGEGKVKRKLDYSDVTPEHWAYKYVITSGFTADSENNFNPDKAITRAQTVQILFDRFGKAGVGAPEFVAQEAKKFGINKDALSWIYTYGILVGDDGLNLRLGDTLTRAEAAALIVKSGKSKTEKNVADIISAEILKNYAEGTGVFKGGYSAENTLTNAELALSAVRFANDTVAVDYSTYNVAAEIDHENSKELYIMCNSAAGLNNFNVNFANAQATVETAEKAIKSAAERLTAKVITRGETLFAKGNKNVSVKQKEVVALMLLYDAVYGSQYAYTTDKKNGSYERLNLSILTNGKKYPKGYKNFAIVLKDVPAEVYTYPTKKVSGGTSGTPAELYDFAREYAPMFVSKCENYVLAADKAMGVDIKITFYPSLAYTNGQGFAFRVKVTALNSTAYTPADLFGEAAITNRDKKLTKGTEFFAEIAVESIA